jgi:hypothetical protein
VTPDPYLDRLLERAIGQRGDRTEASATPRWARAMADYDDFEFFEPDSNLYECGYLVTPDRQLALIEASVSSGLIPDEVFAELHRCERIMYLSVSGPRVRVLSEGSTNVVPVGFNVDAEEFDWTIDADKIMLEVVDDDHGSG